VTHLGGAPFTIVLPLVCLAIPGTRSLGEAMAAANLVSHLAVQALKRSIGRSRPSVREPSLATLADLPDEFSFPSGHASSALAVAVPVLFVLPAVGVAAVLLALLVGASRVCLRVHYVTDVVVGQALGAAAGLLAGARLL
jgi:undecaprenyl-diphosphatase